MAEQTMIPEQVLVLYTQAPDELEATLNRLSAPDMDRSRTRGTWTIRQTVHHLVDGDATWTLLMKAAILNSGCSFGFDWYKGNDRSAEALRYIERAVEPVVQLFRANRTQMAQLLSLVAGAGERYIQLSTPQGTHPITLSQMVALQASHAMEHIAEIRAMRESSK